MFRFIVPVSNSTSLTDPLFQNNCRIKFVIIMTSNSYLLCGHLQFYENVLCDYLSLHSVCHGHVAQQLISPHKTGVAQPPASLYLILTLKNGSILYSLSYLCTDGSLGGIPGNLPGEIPGNIP